VRALANLGGALHLDHLKPPPVGAGVLSRPV